MGDLPVSETFSIRSHAGVYRVTFSDQAIALAAAFDNLHVVVDRKVAQLHAAELEPLLVGASVLELDATEANKSLARMPDYVSHLLAHGIRRDHRLLAIGGGIIQDITCFLAAIVLRGVDWLFLPTTLLAQADSCVGSKSSINCGDVKNIVGTFTPPTQAWLSSRFLHSLDERDVRSGVGEMLKVHAIEGPESFDRIAADYDLLFTDSMVMSAYIRRSLAIKKPYVEVDEFDRGARNVFNFGHSFGHAIEAATDFAVPHGIAVTIGMDVALEVAQGLGLIGDETVTRMRPVLRRNARGFLETHVPMDRFFSALGKDKKNRGGGTVTLILPGRDGRVAPSIQAMDESFRQLCERYFAGVAQRRAVYAS